MHKIGYSYNFVDFAKFDNADVKSEQFYMKSYINNKEHVEWNRYDTCCVPWQRITENIKLFFNVVIFLPCHTLIKYQK
jgi:hypothetical protein